jgi:hypothetical protein
VHGGQRHEEDAIVKVREEAVRHQDSQPGLAASSRAGQGHQPIPLQQLSDFPDLPLPTDEAGQLGRKPLGPGIDRSDSGERLGEAIGLDLVDPDRVREILQPVQPETRELDLGEVGLGAVSGRR